MRQPSERPSKICPACERPFAWRKKWARVWEEVRFCSDACRDGRRAKARVSECAKARESECAKARESKSAKARR